VAAFSGERALFFARSLSFPRKTGGPGWQRSRDYIVTELQKLGYLVSQERFAIQWDPSLFLKGAVAFTLLLLVVSYLVSRNRPFLAFFLMLAPSATILCSGCIWNALISSGSLPLKPRIYPGINLLASLAPRKTSKKQILLVAHYDSKAQRLSLPNRSLLMLCLFLLCLITSLLYLSATFPGFPLLSPPTRKEMAFLSAVTALCALMVYKNKTFDVSPGALDDASGVGVLLALAEAMKDEAPAKVCVSFLITDAEEDGLLGAWSYVRSHREELSLGNACILNLDAVGIEGRLMLLGGGRSELATRLLALARERRIPLRRCFFLPGVLMDHMPFRRKGLEAASLFSFSSKTFRIHTPKDTPDLLEEKGLEQVGELLLTLIRQIDQSGPRIGPLAPVSETGEKELRR